MTDRDPGSNTGRNSGGDADNLPARGSRRVTGTPSEVEQRSLLGGLQEEERAENGAYPTSEAEHRYLEAVEDEQEGLFPDWESVPEASHEREVRTKKAERIAAFLFLVAAIASVGFMVAYAIFPVGSPQNTLWSNHWLGLSMTIAFLAMGAGVVVWIRRIMPHSEVVQERESLVPSDEERNAFLEMLRGGAEATGITKRPILRRSLLFALLPVGLAPLFLVRDLGPLPTNKTLRHTVWRKGMRLIMQGTNQPIKPEDFPATGEVITIVPEGYETDLDVLADATITLLHLNPSDLHLPPDRMAWTVNGIIAFSKICTHAGCPVSLYQPDIKHLLCPCHQSTFDVPHGCRVIFGPATRPLPQLPLGLDDDGYLVAMGDLPAPPGPTFWERGTVHE
ncbi:MAG: cytochrome bc1 complex Rieske iron-sulfur subunit [Streptosporangiaceae bacterium]